MKKLTDLIDLADMYICVANKNMFDNEKILKSDEEYSEKYINPLYEENYDDAAKQDELYTKTLMNRQANGFKAGFKAALALLLNEVSA